MLTHRFLVIPLFEHGRGIPFQILLIQETRRYVEQMFGQTVLVEEFFFRLSEFAHGQQFDQLPVHFVDVIQMEFLVLDGENGQGGFVDRQSNPIELKLQLLTDHSARVVNQEDEEMFEVEARERIEIFVGLNELIVGRVLLFVD